MTNAEQIAESIAHRNRTMFDRLERWILTEFCAAMCWRASKKRTRRLYELSARANQLLKERSGND